jgi:asparaginyl-tRNA synthetase
MEKLKGWIKSIRDSKGLRFFAVTDGIKDHQLTVKEGTPIEGLPKVGASFIAEGEHSTTPKGQPEFLVSKLDIVGASDDDFPIQPKAHSDEFFRSVPELRGKAKKFQAIWKIRHQQTQAIHRILDHFGFIQYYTPIITHADCEGAGESFSVKSDWLDEKLTVSGQLHGEVGMSSLGKIYTFGPTFRAEKSTTRKHLSEFWMIEPEIAFCDLFEAMDVAEDLVKRVLRSVEAKSEYEFKQLGIDDKHTKIADIDWPRIKYDDICEKFGIKWGEDISSDMEQTIVKSYGAPVFITHYPKDLKPFYMKKDDKHALCFDLIFPEVGEIIGGSQREEDYEKLKEQMQSAKLDMDKMQWYLVTRKWGTVPHSGFGLGFDRLLMYITKAQKIHDVIPFPISY